MKSPAHINANKNSSRLPGSTSRLAGQPGSIWTVSNKFFCSITDVNFTMRPVYAATLIPDEGPLLETLNLFVSFR
jgi:hypothetical protein